MSSTLSYSSKSAAIRGASRNGFTPDQITLSQNAEGRFVYTPKAEVALPAEVLLAFEGGDYGLCVGTEARATAQALANDEGVTIYLRCPTGDEVLATVEPQAGEPVEAAATQAEPVEAEAEATEDEGTDADEGNERDTFVPMPTEAEQHDDHVTTFAGGEAANDDEAEAEAEAEGGEQSDDFQEDAPKSDTMLGAEWIVPGRRFIIAVEGDDFPQSSPQAWAMEFAQKLRRPVVVRDAVTFEQVWICDPKAVKEQAKAVRAERKAAAPTERAPKAPKTAPDGKYATITNLCARPEGASPDELFQATKWNKAPWKWLLSNRKGEGICERFGYSLEVKTSGGGKHKTTRYYLTKLPVEAQAEAA